MLSINDLNKIDSMKMYQVYDKWPELARSSYEPDPIDFGDVKHVVFAGMGGSGAIGDMFSSLLSKTTIHVSVVKGYHLPKTSNNNTLVITTSISGNTVETLNVLSQTKRLGIKTISFSSGGKMQTYCKRNSLQHIRVPMFHSPRASFVIYLFRMLSVLNSIIKIKNEDIRESLTVLEKTRKIISSSNLTKTNTAIKLASWIDGIPMIYYPFGLQSAATRFKNCLQENAKSHAMIEDVVEACHNGIVAWEKKSNVKPILIEGKDDYIKTKERWKTLRSYFKENDIAYAEVVTKDNSLLSKLVYLVYFLDYVSIYRGILSKIDPSPVRSIEYIKRLS